MTAPDPMAWAAWVYPIARATGTWPWVRAARLAWLSWLAGQMSVTDMRQQELLQERFALERLP